VDFGALPPEVNSACMYAGARAAPLLAAASAWYGIAAELTTAASSFESVIARLSTEHWMSPASLSMAAAAQPLTIWLTSTAESSALAAAQAMASAAAFETAFATTVPPLEIAANRAELADLMATNVLGQNGPALAATEARYGEMWAQDASAMYGYAAASALAARLDPLATPLEVTNPAGTAAAGSAPQPDLGHLIRTGPDAVMSLASPTASASPPLWEAAAGLIYTLDRAHIPLYDVFHHLRAPYADFALSLATSAAPADADADVGSAAGASAPGTPAASPHLVLPAGSRGRPVIAGLGHAPSVGRLSVPESWSTAAPAMTAATVADGTGWAVPEQDGTIAAMPPGSGMAGPPEDADIAATPRYGVKPVVMPHRGLL
jgi:PPE-repeat protein